MQAAFKGPEISIHALLAESDNTSPGPKSRTPISIHALLAESDHQNMKYVEEVSISIHALLAESDPCAWYAPAGAHISIHALLAESDTDRMFCSRQRLNFYPRSPCGERPSAAAPIKLTRSISIHALLAESDHGDGTHY